MGGAETARNGEEIQRSAASAEDHLRDLFVDITGVEELVETQDDGGESRVLDADTGSVGDAVTDVAKADGLTDTIEEPETEDLD